MTKPRTFCPWPPMPADGPMLVGQAADLVRQACHAEARHRQESPDAFYDYGAGISILLGSLVDLTVKLSRDVQAWPDRCVLFDDTGTEPAAHLARAHAALVKTSIRLDQVSHVVRTYHTAIGHIGVRLDDDGEEPGGGI